MRHLLLFVLLSTTFFTSLLFGQDEIQFEFIETYDLSEILSVEQSVNLQFYQDYGIVCSDPEGMSLLDVSDPEDVTISGVGVSDLTGYYVPKIVDDVLYVNSMFEIAAHDLSNFPVFSESQTLVETDWEDDYYFVELEKQDDFLVLGMTSFELNNRGTISIYNSTDNFNLQQLGLTSTVGEVQDMSIWNNYLTVLFSFYFVDLQDIIRVYDISNPSQPELVGFTQDCYNLSQNFIQVDNYLYFYSSYSIRMFDIADPLNIIELPPIRFDTDYTRNYQMMLGDYYVIYNDYSIHFFDVSDASNPYYLGEFHSPGLIRSFGLNDGYLYVVYYTSMNVYRTEIANSLEGGQSATLPGKITLAKVYPNPFNGTTNVLLNMPENRTGELKIYDVLGRLVNQENLGLLNAGEQVISVNMNQPSGTYFIQVISGEESTGMNKIQLVK